MWPESVERYPFYTDAPRPRQTAGMGGGMEAMRTVFYTIKIYYTTIIIVHCCTARYMTFVYASTALPSSKGRFPTHDARGAVHRRGSTSAAAEIRGLFQRHCYYFTVRSHSPGLHHRPPKYKAIISCPCHVHCLSRTRAERHNIIFHKSISYIMHTAASQSEIVDGPRACTRHKRTPSRSDVWHA